MTSRGFAVTRANLADALTLARIPVAVAALAAAEGAEWTTAALLVAFGWWTDFADGRIARTTTGTRLGGWDHHVDTLVGVALVVGMGVGGHIPALPWISTTLILAAIYVVTRNFAFGQLAQAVGYGLLLWFAARETTIGLVALVVTIVAIAAFDARRFVTYQLPTFFEGMGLRRRSD